MKIVRSSFVLAVPELESAAKYWLEVMGFQPWWEVPGWRCVGRDGCSLMLGECRDALPPSELGDHSYFGYVVFDDLDAYHAEIAARGALIRTPPADKPWGMREMAVGTPDGHRLTFAQDLG